MTHLLRWGSFGMCNADMPIPIACMPAGHVVCVALIVDISNYNNNVRETHHAGTGVQKM